MGKVRRNPLLEAFRAAEVGDREHGAPDQAQVRRRREPTTAKEPLDVNLGDTPFLVVRVSAGVLLALVAGVVAVVAVAFLLGQTYGGAGKAEPSEVPSQAPPAQTAPPTSGERRQALPAAVPPGAAATGAAKAKTTPAPLYTVQVAIYGPGNVSRAEELKTSLLSRGIPDVEVVAIGNQYRVCVGRFPSADDEAAKLALQRVQALSPEFSNAFINRLQ